MWWQFSSRRVVYKRGQRIYHDRYRDNEWEAATVLEGGENPRIVEDRWVGGTYVCNERTVHDARIRPMTEAESNQHPMPPFLRSYLKIVPMPPSAEEQVRRMLAVSDVDDVVSMLREVADSFCSGRETEEAEE